MNIIPRPQSINQYNDRIQLSSKTILKGEFSDSISILEEYLSGYTNDVDNSVTIVRDSTLSYDEYILTIDDNVLIKASSSRASFYAIQTILQLFDDNYLPKCRIEDKPRYGYRGFMLDVARHYFSMDMIKRLLDAMANLKMNYFHWHLTDDQGWRAEIMAYPLLTTKGAIRSSTPLSLKGYNWKLEPRDRREYGRGLFYTQEQMREIVKYARNRYIEVIPEIDMPGHLMSAIACYPELSCSGKEIEVSNRWGVMENIGCCGKENIYQFARAVIDELIEIFPCEYFHIGGDEVPKKNWKACKRCQSKIKELELRGEEELQGYFSNEIATYLKSKGKTMIGWNEILDSARLLDKDIIVQWWQRRKDDMNEMEWLKNGGKFILSTIDYVYMDHPYAVRPLSKTYSFDGAAVGIVEDSIIGVEAPQWTEYISDEVKLELNTYARLIAMSEVGWTSQENKDYKDFENRLESLRDYFESYGLKIAPKEIYRGESLKVLGIKGKGWRLWRKRPHYEIDAMKRLR